MLRDGEEDGIQEQLGEIWSATSHVAHEHWSIDYLSRVELAAPVDRQ